MTLNMNIYNPADLGKPMGQYTHVTRVKANEFLFIAGMLAGDVEGNVVGKGDFRAQTTQVFRNLEAALRSAGASWQNIVQFTTFTLRILKGSWSFGCANFQKCFRTESIRQIRC